MSALECPACGESETQPLPAYNGYDLARCGFCTFTFTKQRQFPPELYDKVYSDVHAYQHMIKAARETQRGDKGYRDLWWSKRMALRWLSRHNVKSVLDLGSGPGTFLLVAKNWLGAQIQGIEPTVTAAKIAVEIGVPTFNGPVETFSDSRTFDSITSFEVLEHIPDPLSALTAARKLLNDSGILILTVPNLDDPYCLHQQIEPAMPPVHINFFSRRSMAALLTRAGFNVQKTFTLPVPTSSVRNIHGRYGWLARLPSLAVQSLFGRADGTTLLVIAFKAKSPHS